MSVWLRTCRKGGIEALSITKKRGIAYDFAVQVYDPETRVEDSENNDIEAYASDGVIYINNYNGVVKVVNIAGQIIKETIVNNNAQIKVGKGIFFVVTNEEVVKVVI